MTLVSNCSCQKSFKFESMKEAMIFVNALNHYNTCEDVPGNLMGLNLNQFDQLVDDFKDFTMSFPAGEGLIL